MTDWKHLIEMAARHEAELLASLASIEPPGDEDSEYADFYDAMETALEHIEDARLTAQETRAAPILQWRKAK